MKQKFIEGTNKQYSIREDGNVFIHYRRKRITNIRKDNIACNDILSILSGNCVDIVFNNKVKRLSINNLLYKYLNYKICNQCKNKFKPNISPVKCDICRILNRLQSAKKYSKKWYYENQELAKLTARLNNKNLVKAYVALTLKIPVHLLNDYLYNVKKQQLLLHREIQKQLKT